MTNGLGHPRGKKSANVFAIKANDKKYNNFLFIKGSVAKIRKIRILLKYTMVIILTIK